MNPGPGAGSVITRASPRAVCISSRSLTVMIVLPALPVACNYDPVRASGRLHFDLLHRFDFSLDLDAVADHHAARLEHLVPREAEVLPIDRRLRCERRADVAPRVLRLAVLFDTQDDLVRDPLDRQ